MDVRAVVAAAQPLSSHRAEPGQVRHGVEEVVAWCVAAVSAVANLPMQNAEYVIDEDALSFLGRRSIDVANAAEEATFAWLSVGGEAQGREVLDVVGVDD